jgi:hypothetical protein
LASEEEITMGVGASLVLFAAGAVMRFAVSVSSTHFNVQTIGVILMIVGAVGFVVSLFFWSSWGGFGGGGGYRRQRTVSGPGGVTQREDVYERP